MHSKYQTITNDTDQEGVDLGKCFLNDENSKKGKGKAILVITFVIPPVSARSSARSALVFSVLFAVAGSSWW